ncbi:MULTISPECIES: bifunctional hydroxymethylpyrimidine kinase/phosphomethylpyrimidine kinase [Allobacillus]|uniref:pyridoxal kinase n=1 Tax=Allobacillus salarius TaxID=1955272 RepID=A0A556PL18_9BACI|nr:bifunctional hydroxymethylpyrimidine kinase/phosphomethylpyrimidine kinase [Allobacillus salarius]TSJ65090.1 bifunctional hydroxymethylpyrimidine kinase/phosphomethylpyrimidine kinase [Allobacillus salarius]
MKKVLIMAGSDTSGGAGIQADLKTMEELGVYGMTALTTMVAQNPESNWAHDVYPIEIDTVKAQLRTILDGIGVDLMKTGMIPTTESIQLAAETIDKYNLEAVVDPVLACKGVDEPVHPENAIALRKILVPKAVITTPNLFEASQLTEMPLLRTVDEMKEAAKKIHDLGAKNVVIKGGSDIDENKAVDVFYDGSELTVLEGEVIQSAYTHGAGCTFASAIAGSYVNGKSPREAVEFAKEFVFNAIKGAEKLNEYVGSVKQYANRK